MKRFHVHLHVDDLSKSIVFYSRLFAAEPARVERDYAKWMLEDPRVNFAISTVGHGTGIDHLGIQADDEDELAELKVRAQFADRTIFDEGETVCCYAKSDKHWVTDPQGIAWEHYRPLETAVVYGQSRGEGASPGGAEPASACCAGPAGLKSIPVVVATNKACC